MWPPSLTIEHRTQTSPEDASRGKDEPTPKDPDNANAAQDNELAKDAQRLIDLHKRFSQLEFEQMSDGRVTVVGGGASESGLATARRFDALAATIDAGAASPQDR